MKNLKFRTQLYIGFAIIIVFSLVSNLFAFYELQKIKNETELIINHPFTVSNAVKDININITAIHRTMKDLALSETDDEFNSALNLVRYHDSIIHASFSIVIERYLGGKDVVMDTYKSYNQWEIIRNEVVSLRKQDLNQEAIKITRGKGDAHVKLLLRKTDILIDFALNKADEFYNNVVENSKRILSYVTVLMIVLFVLSILSSIFISRNILKPIHNFIVQLSKIFLSKEASRPAKLIMDENSLLDYTISELKSAHVKISEQNIKLSSFNEELEKQVVEKTHELQAQNEEYLSLNEEYLTQNDQLVEINKKLEVNERKFRHTFFNANVGVCMVDLDGAISKANNFLSVIFGYKISELEGLVFNELEYSESIDEGTNLNESTKVGSNERSSFEKEYVKKDGNVITCSVSSSLVRDDDDNPLYYIFHVLDVTDKITIREKLKEANATKDKFFSIIAHDLKSPFNVLLGYSKILLENHQKLDENKVNVGIRSIYKSAVNAYKLVENLLTWSRSQSGKLEFVPIEIKLNNIVLDTLESLNEAAEEKDIRIINNVSNLSSVFADSNMLATILRNLVSNAIKFTYKGGEVKIDEQEKDGFVIVSVSDTGIGMMSDLKKKIFLESEKTTTGGTENESGTGLGLILCKEFVEKHGGKIWVESEINEGSVFYFSIPINEVVKTIDEAEGESVDRNIILVVEDEEINYFLIKELLCHEEKFKCEIIHASNGKEAIEVVESNLDIKLVFMDIKMPIMNGYEATKKIKEIKPDLPIIIQTAYNSKDDKEKAFSTGCDDFVSKPLDKEILDKILIKYLKIN